jgi:hypothetical protein
MYGNTIYDATITSSVTVCFDAIRCTTSTPLYFVMLTLVIYLVSRFCNIERSEDISG